MSRIILVTGATGFVGGSLVLELLRATDAEIVCLVRPRRSRQASERLRNALDRACGLYGDQVLLDDVHQRCRVLEGDVTQPGCGVTQAARRRIDEVWHSAASLALGDGDEESIRRTNVDGTRHVLELASDLGVTSYNHISTASVGGTREGVIHEALAPLSTPCGSAYDRSKLEAEHIAAKASVERIRIFRPSIVIGHSCTLAATTFTGLYGLVRDMRGQIESLGDHLTHHPLRLVADPNSPFNCIPVDHVAQAAVKVSQSDSAELVFHLTNSAPRKLAEGLAVVAERAGVLPPRFVVSADELTAVDRRVDEQLTPYRSYLGNPKEFDRTHTDAVLGPDSGRYPLDDDTLAAYVDWYLRRLEGLGIDSMATAEVS